tara:strand:+ start:1896 stop:2081 length:186 start_codon:yes stop_codon:yes gene_type:complete
MKTKELKLSEKEINLLIDGLYRRFDIMTLEANPTSLAAILIDKLYDAKGWIKSDVDSILHK